MAAQTVDERHSWRGAIESVARRLAAVSIAAAVLALSIGGVGGRIAMRILASGNSQNNGMLSDDGFTVGQFTVVGTLQLFGSCVQLGLGAALFYLLVRQLLIGPLWFRGVVLAVGSGVVSAALIVSPDGVDFTRFEPPWLPIALFVALPVVYFGLLVLLSERWLCPASWFATADIRLVAASLVVWIVAGQVLILLAIVAGGWLLREFHASRRRARSVDRSVARWVARGGLTAVFLWALFGLVQDVATLT